MFEKESIKKLDLIPALVQFDIKRFLGSHYIVGYEIQKEVKSWVRAYGDEWTLSSKRSRRLIKFYKGAESILVSINHEYTQRIRLTMQVLD